LAENVLLRKIFGHQRAQLKGWRKLLTDVFNVVFFSPNIIRAKSDKGGECGTYGEKEKHVQRFGG
jgi:hypothetical protein